MFVYILIVCFYVLWDLKYAACHSEYLDKFDVVNMEILEPRNKRTPSLSTYLNVSGNEADVEVRFSCCWKNFHLLLTEDKSFKEIPVESYLNDNSSESLILQATFYEGKVKYNALNSSVIGFISDGLFTGKIIDEDTTFFIEPAAIFFDDVTLNSKIIIYRDVDIRPLEWKIFPRYPDNFSHWKVLYGSPKVSLINVTAENSGLGISNRSEDLFCEIEIVADYTLYNYFKNDTDRLSATLYLHAKFSDYVFRRTDFNMDGISDDIRIVVGRIFIYKSEKDDNYPMLYASSLSAYLFLFVSRRQEPKFCLSIAMLYRRYESAAVGIAYRPEPQQYGVVGGICDSHFPDYGGYGTLSFNTGAINMQFYDGKPLPLAITMLAFTHEMGHGFGSDHDPITHPICSPGKFSNYLMYPESSYRSENAMQFSSCSRKDIWNTLVSKGGCLKIKDSVCGNGIREGNEECDCGSKRFCDLIDPCCTPSDVEPAEKRCTIYSKKGYECSPRESSCCDENCSIGTNENMPCYSDDFQCLYSFCDGKSAICPKPQKVPDNCKPKITHNTANSNTTICVFQGFQDCLCKENLTLQCHHCCLKDNNCTSASVLGLNYEGKPYFMKPGTRCNDGKYVCDNSGNCISSLYLSDSSYILYISLTVIPFFISALLVIAIFITCQEAKRKTVVALRSDI